MTKGKAKDLQLGAHKTRALNACLLTQSWKIGLDRIVAGKLLSRARRHDSFWPLAELDNFQEIRCQIVGFSRSGYRRLSSRRGCGHFLGIFRVTACVGVD